MSEPDHDTESDFDFDLPPLVAQGRLICIDEKHWADLEREREADRAAISAYREQHNRGEGMHGNCVCYTCRDHSAAIQRAQDARAK